MITEYQPRQGRVADGQGYRTWVPPAPLDRWIACFWQLEVPVGRFRYCGVPDNCVDLIIRADCPEDMTLVSPFLRALEFDLAGPATYFGLRFQVLGSSAWTALPVGEWASEPGQVEARSVLDASRWEVLADAVAGQGSFEARCRSLLPRLRQEAFAVTADRRLLRFLEGVHRNPALFLSDSVCSGFGLSARQLRRLSALHLGVAPKAYGRVLRFQCVLGRMQGGDETVSWQDLYYDQAHFIRDFKSMTGLAPLAFNRLSVLYNT